MGKHVKERRRRFSIFGSIIWPIANRVAILASIFGGIVSAVSLVQH